MCSKHDQSNNMLQRTRSTNQTTAAAKGESSSGSTMNNIPECCLIDG